MSQPGSIAPAIGASNPSTSSPSEKAAVAPPKVLTDDEAEEGEILDEEEGEIPENLPAQSAASVAAPTEPASAPIAEPALDSPKQPATPELPTSKTLVKDDEQGDASRTLPDAEVPPQNGVDTSAQTLQPAEPSVLASEQPQPTAEPVPDALSDETARQEAVQESMENPGTSEITTPVAPADAATETQELPDETNAPQEPEDPSTPKVTETEAPQSETATAVAATTPEQSKDVTVDTITQSNEDAQVFAKTLPAAEAQSQADATRADEPADMDVDEKVVAAPQPASVEAEKLADSVPEPMQLDDNVHTPALPSEGLEAPTTAPVESAPEPSVEDSKEQEASAHQPAQSPPQVKSEPHMETYEQTQPPTTQVADTVPSEPATIADNTESVEHARKQESNDLAARPEPIIVQPLPSEPRRRSATPQVAAAASTSDVSRREESQRRATVERDDPSVSRLSEGDRARSRNSNRGSAAPSTGPERRLERERTKDRSHPPERSQDREQRAREKDRRRELERIERERERERERIRESERDREMMIARENEEARLIWLSLPGNDHPQYYTDTDSDSCYGVGGALGVDLTDEEDKDLNPPYPLSLQEYHPAPSYSQSYYDDSFYNLKRKRVEDTNDVELANSSRRYRRKPISSKPSEADRFAPSSSVPVQRQALPSTTMIDIDDFPVPDSGIRSEPSERPFASRLERASLPRISPYARPEDAVEEFESSDSDEEAMRIAEERKRRHGNRGGNRGNKLSREKGARWVRRGKLGGWTEMRMEKEIGDRVRHRVEAMQKDNVRALLSAMPDEDKAMLAQFPALRNGLIPSEAPSDARRDARGRLLPSDVSEAARIDAELGLDGGVAGTGGTRLERPEHLTSTSLAPTLLKPAITPRQLLTSHTLRHTFRNPHIAALGKTALDLIESEGVVGRAVGRCWAAMERGGWNEDPEPKGDESEEASDSHHQNGVNGMDVDGSDAEGSSRHRGEEASGSVFGSPIDNPALCHLDRLFVTKQGLAIPRLDDMGQPIFVPPSPATQAARAQAGMGEEAAGEAVIETTLLPAPEQRSIVLAALECLHDLAADSREYVDRLEEVRSRLAAVKRRRAQVWNAVRQWALDKDIEASLANGGRSDQNGVSRSVAEVASANAAASALSSVASAANGASPKKRK